MGFAWLNTLYYERLLASSDRSAVEEEASGGIASLQTPRDFVRDPVMLEFLGLPGVGKVGNVRNQGPEMLNSA